MNTRFAPEALALAARIATAVVADEQSEGCDLSAGLFGPELSALVAELAAQTLPPGHIPLPTTEVQAIAMVQVGVAWLKVHAPAKLADLK